MKNRFWTSSLAIFATILGLSTAVQAYPWMEHHADHGSMQQKQGSPHLDRMAKKLNLTAEQQSQLKALHEKQQAAIKAQRAQTLQLQAERSAAWAAPTLDSARLESLRQQEVKQFEAMSKLRLEHQFALAKILSPEQRQKMANWQKERRAHRQEQRKKNHDDQDRD